MEDVKTILLVEDEEVLRNLIRDLLESKGYRLHCAAGGEEALGILEKIGGRIDLLLTDVMMPRMNGSELVEILLPQFPGLKVIFMSGFTGGSTTFIQRSLISADVIFLQKPFRLNELLEEIRGLLALPAEPGQKQGEAGKINGP